MADTIISVRINEELKRKMKMLEHINWSAILRKAVREELNKAEEDNFDVERAKKASESADKIRKSKIFDGGKTGTEIIRKWRDKRKF